MFPNKEGIQIEFFSQIAEESKKLNFIQDKNFSTEIYFRKHFTWQNKSTILWFSFLPSFGNWTNYDLGSSICLLDCSESSWTCRAVSEKFGSLTSLLNTEHCTLTVLFSFFFLLRACECVCVCICLLFGIVYFHLIVRAFLKFFFFFFGRIQYLLPYAISKFNVLKIPINFAFGSYQT